ncbi:hypothetical protein D9600_03475 [Deinococcus sp. DB0503]|nr:hypothetical protein [Deinococcus sp. DB0503]
MIISLNHRIEQARLKHIKPPFPVSSALGSYDAAAVSIRIGTSCQRGNSDKDAMMIWTQT